MLRRTWGVALTLLLLTSCTRLVDIDNTVVAEVDGTKIRLQDVLDRLRETPIEDRLRVASEAGRIQLLDDLINEALLLSVAESRGITVTAAEMETAMQAEMQARDQLLATQGAESLPVLRDPETVQQLVLMEKVTAQALSAAALEARYERWAKGPPRDTVQYDFVLVRASNPNLAQEAEAAFREGTPAQELVDKWRGHSDLVNGGRTQPLYTRLLAPWLQRELATDPRPGTVLAPYMDQEGVEPTIMVVRLINRWRFPPLAVVYDTLVDELYAEFLTELKAERQIARYPERLGLLERR